METIVVDNLQPAEGEKMSLNVQSQYFSRYGKQFLVKDGLILR